MRLTKYLREQVKLHPSMEPVDAIKLCFQASYGAEHMLKNMDAAKTFFEEEYARTVVDGENEPLYEHISDVSCRVNLREWKRRGLPGEWLFNMFTQSNHLLIDSRFRMEFEKRNAFAVYLKDVELLIEEGVFGFDMEQWKQCLSEYPMDNPIAVHHSDAYREKERPSYRVVSRHYIKLFPVLEALAKLPDDKVKIVAIEGKCGSGKTIYAKGLAALLVAGTVHMDDFFLPEELRTPERLEEPGGNIHYERFISEVLPNLRKSEEFTYGRFDCGKMTIRGERRVDPAMLRIVEGSYSCHPQFGDYMDIRVFLDVDEEEQERRLADRDGEDALEKFKSVWIPMEKKYFETFDIPGKADVSVFNQNL